jgi:hypothetical protein
MACPQTNYTDRATAACQRSWCQLFADRGCHVVSVTNPYGRILALLDRSRYYCFQVAPQLHSRGLVNFSENLVASGIEPGPLDL